MPTNCAPWPLMLLATAFSEKGRASASIPHTRTCSGLSAWISGLPSIELLDLGSCHHGNSCLKDPAVTNVGDWESSRFMYLRRRRVAQLCQSERKASPLWKSFQRHYALRPTGGRVRT